jgi:hypothetical protein
MKKLNRIKYFTGLLVAIIAWQLVKKVSLRRPPLSSVVDATFIKPMTR